MFLYPFIYVFIIIINLISMFCDFFSFISIFIYHCVQHIFSTSGKGTRRSFTIYFLASSPFIPNRARQRDMLCDTKRQLIGQLNRSIIKKRGKSKIMFAMFNNSNLELVFCCFSPIFNSCTKLC